MSTIATLTLETVEGDGLRFGAVSGAGRRLTLDSGPGVSAASPVDAVLMALAGCHAMDVVSILRKQRQQVTGYTVEAVGERRAEHPRGFVRIELVHRLTGRSLSHAAVERAIELSHTRYCSVQASLDPRIDVTNRFEIAEAPEPPGASPLGAGDGAP